MRLACPVCLPVCKKINDSIILYLIPIQFQFTKCFRQQVVQWDSLAILWKFCCFMVLNFILWLQ